jgi:hypothetical protein
MDHLNSHSGSLALMPVRLSGWTTKGDSMTNANPTGVKPRSDSVQVEERWAKSPETLAVDFSKVIV